MPIIKYILWTILSLGMVIIAIMAFWVFLIIIGVIILARIIYLKLFNKGSSSITIHRYSMNYDPKKENSSQNSPYTTVIDAEDPDTEYKIPKIK